MLTCKRQQGSCRSDSSELSLRSVNEPPLEFKSSCYAVNIFIKLQRVNTACMSSLASRLDADTLVSNSKSSINLGRVHERPRWLGLPYAGSNLAPKNVPDLRLTTQKRPSFCTATSVVPLMTSQRMRSFIRYLPINIQIGAKTRSKDCDLQRD